jgi:hypothetical protein
MEARAIRDAKPFTAADQQFDAMKERLQSGECLRMSHSDLEREMETEGRELLRRLFQAHVDVRGPGAVSGPVVGGDGIERTHSRIHDRRLATVFGDVEVARIGYGARGQGSLHPLDAALNLPPESYSLEVRHKVAEAVAKNSFDEAAATMKRTTGAPVPKRQVEQLAVKAAVDFDAFYAERQASPDVKASQTTGPIVVLSSDGKGVVMRKEDLRDETRKAVEQRRPKMTKRLSKGEKKNAKRIATVAATYSVQPFVRKPEAIIRDLAPVYERGVQRPRPEDKRVWASLAKKPEEVIEEAMYEALRRDPCLGKTWVALVDGNEAQLRILQRLSDKHGVQLTLILDFIHVAEYVWEAAFAFNGEGTAEAQEWVSERLLEILKGRASHVAGGIRRSATLRGLRGEKRAAADACADYLIKYAPCLEYDEYLANGFPISTGVIEGTCRYLVKDRMDITGARWSLLGAEAILKLRALRASGDFGAYWQFHEQMERRRNHETLYANATLPAIALRSPRAHLRLVK